MKRFVMAVALSGLISVTALAGNIPTGDFVSPPPLPATTTSSTSSTSSTWLTEVVFTIITVIGR